MQNYKEINGVNSLAAIEDRLRKGTLPQAGVIAMTPARAGYSYLAQLLIIALLFMVGNAHPYESSLGWWTVWGTAVDIACLITLTLLVRREGIQLFDLVGVMRSQLKHDLLLVIPFTIALIVPAAVIGTILQRVFYPSAPLGPHLQVMHLPLWASIYSIVVWPAVWTFTEEVTYLGYLFPRLEVMTRSTTWAAVIVLAFWTIQHPALPLIITHWIADLSPGITALLFVH